VQEFLAGIALLRHGSLRVADLHKVSWFYHGQNIGLDV
jgi:hypothetical protein